MIINGLNFINTCERWPEQYDVKDEKGNQIAYIRLRWGVLKCTIPDVGGEEIYFHCFDNEFQGFFESKEQRQHHLSAIADKILEKVK